MNTLRVLFKCMHMYSYLGRVVCVCVCCVFVHGCTFHYVYTGMCVYIFPCIEVYVHVYEHTCVQMCVYTCIHMYKHWQELHTNLFSVILIRKVSPSRQTNSLSNSYIYAVKPGRLSELLLQKVSVLEADIHTICFFGTWWNLVAASTKYCSLHSS